MFKKVLFPFFILAIILISLSIWGCLPDLDASIQAFDPQTAASPGASAPVTAEEFSFFRQPPVIIDRADTVLALNCANESIYGESGKIRREYPYGSLAGALLGFRGKHGQGLYGIEYLCDTFAAQGMRAPQGLKENRFALTISKDIQIWAEDDLQRQMKRLKAETGALVMMDISSGEILAMASMPDWNPQNEGDSPDHAFVNHAIEDEFDAWMFFPIMEWLKLYTLAEADATSTSTDKRGSSAGKVLCSEDSAPDWKKLFVRTGRRKRAWGNITSDLVLWSPWDHEIMKQFRFYPSAIRDMWKMGLGQDTGLGLSKEKSGSLPFVTPANWDSVAFNTVKATPVQMLRAFSAIINAGSVPEVTITKKQSGSSGEKIMEKRGVDWLTKDASDWIRRELALNDGPSIAAIKRCFHGSSARTDGKTKVKCAQVVSFGFWPEKNPRVAYISILGNTAFDPRVRRGTLGKTIRTAKKAWCLLENELKPGVRMAALPGMKNSGLKSKKTAVMPDLRGVTMRQAIRAAMDAGLATVVRGSGTVAEQYPSPGSSIRKTDKCTIVCRGWTG